MLSRLWSGSLERSATTRSRLMVRELSQARGASSLGAEGGCRYFWTDTWHVDAAEAAAEAAAAAAAVASATACAIRISDALFGANALACDARAPVIAPVGSSSAGLFPCYFCSYTLQADCR